MEIISFEEIGDLTVTFAADVAVTEGSVVKIVQNGRVGACKDGDKFFGVARKPCGDMVGVQMRGFVQVPYSGVLNPGMTGLLANGQGGVKAGDGNQALVISVDDEQNTAVIFL